MVGETNRHQRLERDPEGRGIDVGMKTTNYATLQERADAHQSSRTVRERSVRPVSDAAPGPNALLHARPLEMVIAEVQQILEDATTHATHPRHFGLFVSSVCPASCAADALAAVYNPQLGAHFYAPGAVAIETATLGYLKAKIGFGPDAEAMFTPGGSEANLCGVLAALGHAFDGWAARGITSLPKPPRIYLSRAAHDSFVKIARMTGLGDSALRRIETDRRGRLSIEALERAMADDRRHGHAPFVVVAATGTTANGAVDPLDALADLCRQEGVWLHADAAWGGGAVLSPKLRHCVAGLSRADSITWDAHKTLPVPTAAGMFFARHPGCLAEAFDVRPPYVPEDASHPDAYTSTPQWSRRFIGLKVYMTLAERGEKGIARLVEHQATMGQRLREALLDAGFSVVNDSPLPLVTFVDPKLDSEATRRWIDAVVESGEAWIFPVIDANDRVIARACITHHETGPDDLDARVATLVRHRPCPPRPSSHHPVAFAQSSPRPA